MGKAKIALVVLSLLIPVVVGTVIATLGFVVLPYSGNVDPGFLLSCWSGSLILFVLVAFGNREKVWAGSNTLVAVLYIALIIWLMLSQESSTPATSGNVVFMFMLSGVHMFQASEIYKHLIADNQQL